MATLLQDLSKELNLVVNKQDRLVEITAPSVNDPAPEHRRNSAGKRFTLIANQTDKDKPKNIKE